MAKTYKITKKEFKNLETNVRNMIKYSDYLLNILSWSEIKIRILIVLFAISILSLIFVLTKVYIIGG